MDELNMANSLWAWVTEYPDGSVGMIGTTGIIVGMMMPLMGRNKEMVLKMRAIAHEHGRQRGQRVWLRRYDKAEDYDG